MMEELILKSLKMYSIKHNSIAIMYGVNETGVKEIAPFVKHNIFYFVMCRAGCWKIKVDVIEDGTDKRQHFFA